MLTIYSDDHHLHHGKYELIDGQLTPCFEKPSRADMVLARAQKVKLGEVVAPREFGLAPILRVHDEGFVHFLKDAWAEWQAMGRDYDMLPFTWPNRRLRQTIPDCIDGKFGYYSFDAGVPITAGTWQAVSSSVNVALTGQAELAKGARFEDLARSKSKDMASGVLGGDLGWAPGAAYVPEFTSALQALKQGETSQPVKTQFGYHLIRLDGVRAAQNLPPFEQVKGMLAEKLEQDKVQAMQQAIIDQARIR